MQPSIAVAAPSPPVPPPRRFRLRLVAVEESPQRRHRKASARKRQEARWARKSGPVTVRFDPSVVRRSEPVDSTQGERGVEVIVSPPGSLEKQMHER